jgi:ribulose-phosphate 3-epimerase
MIIPTILEKDEKEILNKVQKLKDVATHFQIDIVDPKVFNGETIMDLKVLESIDDDISVELDLLVEEPLKFVKRGLKNVTKISANIKGKDIDGFVYKCTEYGYLTGVSLNMDTPEDQYATIIDGLDYVQFMSVVPGAQGRKFENGIINKIKTFIEKNPGIPVQVDGGLDEAHIKELFEIGVNIFVVGSAIFKSDDPQGSYNKLVKAIKDEKSNS